VNVLYWSKNVNLDAFPDTSSVGIHGLELKLIGNNIARFTRDERHCDITIYQIVILGTDWANRKLRRFRRYCKRMEREG